MKEPVSEATALAHASRGGHVCGAEAALRVFALAVIKSTDAEEVFVTPEHTFVRHADKMLRYPNSAELRKEIGP